MGQPIKPNDYDESRIFKTTTPNGNVRYELKGLTPQSGIEGGTYFDENGNSVPFDSNQTYFSLSPLPEDWRNYYLWSKTTPSIPEITVTPDKSYFERIDTEPSSERYIVGNAGEGQKQQDYIDLWNKKIRDADRFVSRGWGSRAWGKLGGTMGAGALTALGLSYGLPFFAPGSAGGNFLGNLALWTGLDQASNLAYQNITGSKNHYMDDAFRFIGGDKISNPYVKEGARFAFDFANPINYSSLLEKKATDAGIDFVNRISKDGFRIGDKNYSLGWYSFIPKGSMAGTIIPPGVPVIKSNPVQNYGYDREQIINELKDLISNPNLQIEEPGLYNLLQEQEFGQIVDNIIKEGSFNPNYAFDVKSLLKPDARAIIAAEYQAMKNPNSKKQIYNIGVRGTTPDYYESFKGNKSKSSGDDSIDRMLAEQRFLSNNSTLASAKYGYRDPIHTQLYLQDLLNQKKITEEQYNYARTLNDYINNAVQEIGLRKGTNKGIVSTVNDEGYVVMNSTNRNHPNIQFAELDPKHPKYQNVGNDMTFEEANQRLNQFFTYLDTNPDAYAGAWNQRYLYTSPGNRTIDIKYDPSTKKALYVTPTYMENGKVTPGVTFSENAKDVIDAQSKFRIGKFQKRLQDVGFNIYRPFYLKMDNVNDPFLSDIRTGVNLIPFKKGGKLKLKPKSK